MIAWLGELLLALVVEPVIEWADDVGRTTDEETTNDENGGTTHEAID